MLEPSQEKKVLFWQLIININRLHRRGFTVVITGSNSQLLSRKLATHLTGRHTQFQILPFSFREFLRAREFSVDETIALKEKQGVLLNHLNQYMNSGGYPEIVIKEMEPRGGFCG
jgi:predicted AAA+ superfamily ATPase